MQPPYEFRTKAAETLEAEHEARPSKRSCARRLAGHILSRTLSPTAMLLLVVERVIGTGIIVGAGGFALGFLGPMVLDPSNGNGPLLGIFVTGPVGFVAGILWGLARERRLSKTSALEQDRPSR
jgi:hypothetical protein